MNIINCCFRVVEAPVKPDSRGCSGNGDPDTDGPNYNEFMQLVMEYGAAKAAYAAVKASGKYELRKERRLGRQASAAFEKVADAAARRFPGGKDYVA